MKAKYKISCSVAAIVSAWAGMANAAATQVAAADTASAGGIEEIVVTAQRRNESIQDVPITIQAIGSDSLSKLNITTFDDVIKMLPNVTFGTNGPGQGNIFMRGLSAGFAGGQSTASISPFPNVATYLDDQSLTFPGRNGMKARVLDRPALAHGKVRFVGDRVALEEERAIGAAGRAHDAAAGHDSARDHHAAGAGAHWRSESSRRRQR